MMPTNGKDTTHLSVQPSGQYLFAASYTSGNFQVFHINSDGSIGGMTLGLPSQPRQFAASSALRAGD